MRSSVYIEGSAGEAALIDAGPEFRLQALRARINRLDAIFLTHAHADHIHGLDDVRPLTRDKSIPVYGNNETIGEMVKVFSYVWEETQPGGGKPRLTPLVIDRPVHIGSLVFTPVPVKHGFLDILGWKVEEDSVSGSGKSFLYLTDTSAIPPASFRLLSRPESPSSRVIIIGGLRARPHETHFNFEQALDAAVDLGAGRAYLTHICHDHSHTEIENYCREFGERQRISGRITGEADFHPAYDELELTL